MSFYDAIVSFLAPGAAYVAVNSTNTTDAEEVAEAGSYLYQGLAGLATWIGLAGTAKAVEARYTPICKDAEKAKVEQEIIKDPVSRAQLKAFDATQKDKFSKMSLENLKKLQGFDAPKRQKMLESEKLFPKSDKVVKPTWAQSAGNGVYALATLPVVAPVKLVKTVGYYAGYGSTSKAADTAADKAPKSSASSIATVKPKKK